MVYCSQVHGVFWSENVGVAEGRCLGTDDTAIGGMGFHYNSVSNKHSNVSCSPEHVSGFHLTPCDSLEGVCVISMGGQWNGVTLVLPSNVGDTLG